MNKRIYIILIITILILISIFMILKYRGGDSSPQITTEEVLLYFSTRDALYLKAESRTVEGENIYLETVKELIKGPDSSSLNRTIPDEVKVLDIDINEGTAVIDFNMKLKENHWGGSTGERMTVYSIVNTLTQFENIDHVKFLLEGEEIDTLAGHMDLTVPVPRNDEIIEDEKQEK